jgi:hypothetical protein
MRKITNHVYAETEFPGANVGCVITELGPILIDTPMLPEEASELRKGAQKSSILLGHKQIVA